MQFLESQQRTEELGYTASLEELWEMADLVRFLLGVSPGLVWEVRRWCLSQADPRALLLTAWGCGTLPPLIAERLLKKTGSITSLVVVYPTVSNVSDPFDVGSTSSQPELVIGGLLPKGFPGYLGQFLESHKWDLTSCFWPSFLSSCDTHDWVWHKEAISLDYVPYQDTFLFCTTIPVPCLPGLITSLSGDKHHI